MNRVDLWNLLDYEVLENHTDWRSVLECFWVHHEQQRIWNVSRTLERVTSDVNQPDKLHNNEFINHLVVYLAEG